MYAFAQATETESWVVVYRKVCSASAAGGISIADLSPRNVLLSEKKKV